MVPIQVYNYLTHNPDGSYYYVIIYCTSTNMNIFIQSKDMNINSINCILCTNDYKNTKSTISMYYWNHNINMKNGINQDFTQMNFKKHFMKRTLCTESVIQ